MFGIRFAKFDQILQIKLNLKRNNIVYGFGIFLLLKILIKMVTNLCFVKQGLRKQVLPTNLPY